MAKTKAQIMEERKENESRDLMQLSQYSPLIKIRALDAGRGHAPTQYEIVYTCRGYAPKYHRQIRDRFVVRMTLPADYPFCTPNFHCVDPPTIEHPHIFESGWICVGHETGMPVGLQLRQYVIGVGEMIQWRKATDGKGDPVDTRPLVGREPDQAQAPQPVPSTPPTAAPPPKAPAPPASGRIVIKPQPGKIVIKPRDTIKKTK